MANSTVAAITAVLMLILSTGCKGTPKTDGRERASAEKPGVRLGAFSADSAYNYIAGQVSFGPRVPGSDGHRACRDYIVETLRRHGADSIIVQQATVEAYNGDRLPISNIIAGFNLQSAKRILLAAHWDTRPWADMETSETLRQRPIEGANDGGSGVGVLLEIARNFAAKRPSVGVDLFFIDAEDYGNSDGFGMNADTWCLGSQYWAQNMVPYKADNLRFTASCLIWWAVATPSSIMRIFRQGRPRLLPSRYGAKPRGSAMPTCFPVRWAEPPLTTI